MISVLQIPPANQFLNIFAGLLSQHVSESCLERARTRLVEVHKWHQCLVAPVSVLSFLEADREIIRSEHGQRKNSLDSKLQFYTKFGSISISKNLKIAEYKITIEKLELN